MKHLPQGWKIEKLENIAKLIIGKTPSRAIPEYFSGENLWTSIADIKEKFIFNTKEKITDEAVKKSGIKKVKKGTLLLSYKLSIGKLAFAGKDLFTNEAIAGLELINPDINNEFLYYVLKNTDWDENTDRAVKGKTLNKGKLNEIEIPFPPLPQQEKNRQCP
jgi:restriction endonuclease S subunit